MNAIATVDKAIYSLRGILIKKSPEILTAMGVVGLVTTAAMAIKSTPQAMQILEECEDKKEKAIELAKCYAPTAGMLLVTSVCIISANRVSAKRQAAVATLYSLSEAKLKEYQDKVKKEVGEKKEKDIRDKISEDKVRSTYTDTGVIYTGKGDTLCYDSMSGRYFKHDIEKIRAAVNDVNKQIIGDMAVSLNEFYWALGLDGIKLGDEMGWNTEAMLDIEFSSCLANNMQPCLCINYTVEPFHWYRDL